MHAEMSAPPHEMLEKLKIDCKEYLVNKAIVLFKFVNLMYILCRMNMPVHNFDVILMVATVDNEI